ncbi:AAA family ATPase [Pseudomonas chlororaphis]|nr:AAA family ATPase [Pseudomonas chlororaphis]
MMSEQTRICLVGPSGSGKSTVASLIKQKAEQQGKTVGVLKLAEPLYKIQEMFYRESGVNISAYRQDQQLLEKIAVEMRTISPASLIDNFLGRLAVNSQSLLINDDLRDHHVDWPRMVAAGFIVVRVATDPSIRRTRLNSRGDMTRVEKSPLDQQIAFINSAFVLVNNGDLNELDIQVNGLMPYLLRSQEVN